MATWNAELGKYQVFDNEGFLRGLVDASSEKEAVAIQNAIEKQNRIFDGE